jgi:hypothetical protein
MSAVPALASVLRPPRRPSRVVPDWAAVEGDIGTALPGDYKWFVDIYGVGRVDGFLSVFHPTSNNTYLRLKDQIARQLGALRTLREMGEEVPYPLFPEPAGILPWAITDNGNVCHWRTGSANPDEWTVVVDNGRAPWWDEFPGSMTAFLSAVLSRRYQCSVFPIDFPSSSPRFTRSPNDY